MSIWYSEGLFFWVFWVVFSFYYEVGWLVNVSLATQ